jgi:hypothetical protein
MVKPKRAVRMPQAIAHFEKCRASLRACAKAFGLDLETSGTRLKRAANADVADDYDTDAVEAVVLHCTMLESSADFAIARGDNDGFAVNVAQLSGMLGYLSTLVRREGEHKQLSSVRAGRSKGTAAGAQTNALKAEARATRLAQRYDELVRDVGTRSAMRALAKEELKLPEGQVDPTVKPSLDAKVKSLATLIRKHRQKKLRGALSG